MREGWAVVWTGFRSPLILRKSPLPGLWSSHPHMRVILGLLFRDGRDQGWDADVQRLKTTSLGRGTVWRAH